MAFLTGQNFASRLIEALGLQHQNVRAITIHCRVDEAARVTVEHYVTEEQGDAVADLLAATGGGIEVETVPVPVPAGEAYHVHYYHDGPRRRIVSGDRQAADNVAYHLARRHAAESVVTLTNCCGSMVGVWRPDGTTLARAMPGGSWINGRWRE